MRITGQAQPLRGSGAGAASRLAPQREADPASRRWMALVLGGVTLVVVLVVLLVTGVFSSGGSSSPATHKVSQAKPQTPTKTTATTPAKPAKQAYARSDSKVFVLNGTFTSGLAGVLATQLKKDGFAAGQSSVATATNQNQSATVIYYMPSHHRDALEVRKVLTSASVQPVSANPAICNVQPPAKPCQADAIVVVGADQNH